MGGAVAADPRPEDVRASWVPDDLVAAEIAPALHLAPVTAAIRVNTALEVSTRLPATLAAMCRGELDKGRVLAIRDATAVLDDDLARQGGGRGAPGRGRIRPPVSCAGPWPRR